jgi:hypothetical protein
MAPKVKKPSRQERKRERQMALSPEAVTAAEDKRLGAHVDSFPLQVNEMITFVDTGRLVHLFVEGFIDARPPDNGRPEYSRPVAVRFDEGSGVDQAATEHYRRTRYGSEFYKKTTFEFAVHAEGRKELIRWKGAFWDETAHGGHRGDPRLPLFARQLVAMSSERRLSACRQAIEDGKPLAFGKIVLTPEGVRRQGGGVSPWSQVWPVDITNGVAMVRAADVQGQPIATERVGNIPNLPMFRVLFDEFRRPR